MLKFKSFALIAGCLIATPVLVSAQAAGSVEYLLNYARTYLAEGQTTSAANYAREALALDPANAEAREIINRTSKTSNTPLVRQAASGAPVPAREEPVGSAAYFLKYARDHLNAGNFSGATSYAQDALKVDPGNGDARAILRAASAKKAPAAVAGKPGTGGADPARIGSAAYFLNYARHHLENGAYAAAASYAKQALASEPGSAEARRILALTHGRREKGASSSSCEAQFSVCWAGAKTYTPGSGYKSDDAGRQQCFVQRNLCSARNQ